MQESPTSGAPSIDPNSRALEERTPQIYTNSHIVPMIMPTPNLPYINRNTPLKETETTLCGP